jgi:hypothetical protein
VAGGGDRSRATEAALTAPIAGAESVVDRMTERCKDMPTPVAELVTRELDASAVTTKPSWSKSEGGLTLEVWRHRYQKEDEESFAHRSVHFRASGNSWPIAAGHFVEWRGPPISFLNEFFYAADAQSQADHDTADILQTYWSDETAPFLYGTLVRFERLVIRSTNRSPEVWALLSGLIEREFARRGSILMLKAFPLEYEGRHNAGSPAASHEHFRLRAMAMRRYYRWRLKMRRVPGRYGKDGGMWRPLRFCPPPAQRKGRRS